MHSCECDVRLALELFRGEPAISRFVRHFTTYPQVIAKFCNICAFGLPWRVTATSSCPWVAHQVSGLLRATRRPLRTRFRCASACLSLRLATHSNSLGHSSRGTPSDFDAIACTHSPRTARRHTVSGTISLPSAGCFSPFPHGTRSLSVAKSI